MADKKLPKYEEPEGEAVLEVEDPPTEPTDAGAPDTKGASK